MEKLFISYKQALAFKEMGFVEKGLAFYRGDDGKLIREMDDIYPNRNIDFPEWGQTTAPTYDQAKEWLFREKKIYLWAQPEGWPNVYFRLYFCIIGKIAYQFNPNEPNHYENDMGTAPTYEKANERLIECAIDLLKTTGGVKW